MKTKLIRPVVEPYVVTSPYGMRWIQGKWKMHDGIDYVGGWDGYTAGGSDRRVLSICDGTVLLDEDYYDHSKRWTDMRHSMGNYLIVAYVINGATYYARYCHLKENYVSKGENVYMGQVIGLYDDVGYSFGAHLHFDMYDANWKKINPTPILIDGLKASGRL